MSFTFNNAVTLSIPPMRSSILKIIEMEKKPIKRNEHIIMLSKDHHFTLLFCWKIRNGLKLGIEPGRIKRYVQYFWEHHLRSHFAEEETILFAPVKDAAVQKAIDDHAKIAEQIKALDANDDNTKNNLSALADTVDNHVRYEERELFPHLEQVLTDDQLEKIGKQLTTRHNAAVKDDFADEFWLKDQNGL
jgi:hemerythrin-like domain-containing protein